MQQEKKERTYFWLPPSLLDLMDSQLSETDSKNRSDYARKAIAFYSGYIASRSAEDYMSETLLGELDKRLKRNEAHISKTIFRLAVELAMTMHLVAFATNIDESILPKLHKRCIAEVKSANGYIRFDKTYEYQHEDDEE